MSNYSALLIDDEAGARQALRRLLELFCPEVSAIVEAEDEQEALKHAQSQQFDLAFVDIELRQGSGLDLAEELIRYCQNLIFVTAHDKYAVDAFQTPAVNYLLKPVIPKQLKAAVAGIKSTTSKTRLSSRVLLPIVTGFIVLEQSEIIRLEGEGNYCQFFCLGDKQYYLSRNMGHFEKQLDGRHFMRIHQSHLVNLAHVREYSTEQGYEVILKNGDRLPLAVRRKEEFLARMAEMLD